MALTDIDGGRLADNAFELNKNLIINGAMQVAQRGTQVTGVTTAAYQTCDRCKFNVGTLGTWTIDQDTNAPNGFSNSFKITCTTADASPASGDYLNVVQYIEAQNLQGLGFGTSDAKALTLSFWVRSNKTGNASFGILQPDNSNKQVSFQYNISSADTWEHKTIAIPSDTAGVINNDNGNGLQLEWWLNSGSDFTSGSHQATWSTFSNTNRNPSNLGVGGATSDYWQITGVQLEVGSVATPFEHRSYGDELRRCQRYYWNPIFGRTSTQTVYLGIGAQYDGTTGFMTMYPPVAMRTEPTLTVSNSSGHFKAHSNNGFTSFSTMSIDGLNSTTCLTTSGSTSRTAGHAIFIEAADASNTVFAYNAEL